jgi:hypothetical protein
MSMQICRAVEVDCSMLSCTICNQKLTGTFPLSSQQLFHTLDDIWRLCNHFLSYGL